MFQEAPQVDFRNNPFDNYDQRTTTVTRLSFSLLGSASTALQCQNSDISANVERSKDDPLPFQACR